MYGIDTKIKEFLHKLDILPKTWGVGFIIFFDDNGFTNLLGGIKNTSSADHKWHFN